MRSELMKKQSTPWLDANGNFKTEDEIKNLSKTWKVDDWEEYLASTVEKPLLETLPNDPGFIENCESNYHQAYQKMLAKEDYPNLQLAIRTILKDLTTQEQKIIYGVFWQEKSLSTLARELKVSKGTVENYKSRALGKLGFFFLENFALNKLSTKGLEKSYDRFFGRKPIGKEEVSTDQVVGA
jgi:DNA-directed RNA polymerase specialized sigma subunit